MRTPFTLTPQERDRFNDLRDEQGEAFKFWKAVAAVRNLDHKSILSDERFNHTALPVGHGKQWCYPADVKCKTSPVGVK